MEWANGVSSANRVSKRLSPSISVHHVRLWTSLLFFPLSKTNPETCGCLFSRRDEAVFFFFFLLQQISANCQSRPAKTLMAQIRRRFLNQQCEKFRVFACFDFFLILFIYLNLLAKTRPTHISGDLSLPLAWQRTN